MPGIRLPAGALRGRVGCQVLGIGVAACLLEVGFGVKDLRVRAHLHVWVEVTGHLASRDFVVLSRTFVVLVPTNKKIQPNRSINNGKAEHTRDQYSSFSISHIETHKSLSFLPSRQTRAYVGLLTLTHKTIFVLALILLPHTHIIKKKCKKKN